MTNLEYLSQTEPEKIAHILAHAENFNIEDDGHISTCLAREGCNNCMFRDCDGTCVENAESYLLKEYKEPSFENPVEYLKRMIKNAYNIPFIPIESMGAIHRNINDVIMALDFNSKISVELYRYNNKVLSDELFKRYEQDRKRKTGD